MSFLDELQSYSNLEHTISEMHSNNYKMSLSDIDSVCLYKLDGIKDNLKHAVLSDIIYYDNSSKQKSIYGIIDFLRFSTPSEGLFSFMFTSDSKSRVSLTQEGKTVFEHLRTACANDEIILKIGTKAPQGKSAKELRGWFNNALYTKPDSISKADSPYQVYLGFKVTLDMTDVDIKKNGNDSDSGDCFIATAVYGSYNCPEVWTLRRFRDHYLAQRLWGRVFIKMYYALSPKVVALFGSYLWFSKMFRPKLDAFVQTLQKKGYDNSPYDDLKW